MKKYILGFLTAILIASINNLVFMATDNEKISDVTFKIEHMMKLDSLKVFRLNTLTANTLQKLYLMVKEQLKILPKNLQQKQLYDISKIMDTLKKLLMNLPTFCEDFQFSFFILNFKFKFLFGLKKNIFKFLFGLKKNIFIEFLFGL